MRAVVRKNGELTLPAEARQWLGIGEDEAVEVEISRENGHVVVRPMLVIPDEDAWFYTPEHQAQLARAMEDVRAGRVRQMSELDLKRLVGLADDDPLED